MELGVTFIDTADAYALGDNESLIREALHPYAEDLVIATKVGNTRPSPDAWVAVGRPEYHRQQTELSLRRLGVDRIDLLQIHRLDPTVPLEDQVGTLAALRDEGKVAHIGLSEVTVAQLEAAAAVTPIATVQNLYNVVNRQSEAVLAHAEAEGIGFIPWFPIAAGEAAAPGGPVAEAAAAIGVTPARTPAPPAPADYPSSRGW